AARRYNQVSSKGRIIMQRSRAMVETKAEAIVTEKVKRKNRAAYSYPFYFIAGALILYVVFTVIPGITGLFYSFTDWNSFTDKGNFVGLDNFAIIFSSDENYLSFVKNTLVFTVATI